MLRVIWHVLWVPFIVWAWHAVASIAVQHGFWALFWCHVGFGVTLVIQLVYIQIVIFKARQTDQLITQLVNEATDAADDELRDPRDNSPYERHTPPGSTSL